MLGANSWVFGGQQNVKKQKHMLMIFQSCLRWFCREHAKNAQSVDLLSQGPLANLSRSIMDVFCVFLKGPAGRFFPMCFVYSISNNKALKKLERLQRLPPMGPKGPIAHPRGSLKPKFVSRPQNTKSKLPLDQKYKVQFAASPKI